MSTSVREIKLNKTQHQQYKTVKEFKPEWNDEEIIDFCQQRDWQKNAIQDDLQKAFEFDHSSLEQWHTVGKKEEKTQTTSSTRGRSSERGGRGRGRARFSGVSRGGRGGSVAASERSNGGTGSSNEQTSQEESKGALSSSEEKQPLASTENRIHRPVDIRDSREKTGKRSKREKESSKSAVSAVQLPTPGKSYAMAVKPLPPPPVVQAVHPPTTSTASLSHTQTSTKKPEEPSIDSAASQSTTEVAKVEEKEEKKAPVVPVHTGPSFASLVANAPKGAWRRKKEVVTTTVSQAQPQAVTTAEASAPKEEVSKKEFDEEKTETKVEVIATVVESTPLEEESKVQDAQSTESVEPQLTPTATESTMNNISTSSPAPESSHHLLQSQLPAPKSPAPKSAPRSPAKSPLKLHESSLPVSQPEVQPLPPSVLSAVSSPLPASVSTAALIANPAPVSELLTATETVILPQHIIAAVHAPAVQIQFGSAKAGGPRAPQPQQAQASVAAAQPVAAPQVASVQAAPAQQAYAAATTIGSQRTVPISSILGTVNAVQSDAAAANKFQGAAESAPVVAAATEQTYEQHHQAHTTITHPTHTEEQALLQQQQQQQQPQAVTGSTQSFSDAHSQPAGAAHGGAEHQHNLYGANFQSLSQTSTAATVGGPVSGADNYAAQSGYVGGEQQGDMYSMYGAADQQNYQSMYGDQFYGQQMRRGGPQDVKGKPKFNAIGPGQNRGPQQHNKPHQQQQQQRQPTPQQQQPFTNQQAQGQRITPGGYQAANQYNNQVQYNKPNVPASPQHNIPQYQQQQQQQQGKGAVGQYKPNQYNQAKNVPINQPINQTPGMVSNQFGYGMHAGAYGTSAAPYLSYPQQYYGGYYGMQQQQPFYRQPQYPFYPSTYSSYPAPMTGGFDQSGAYDANGQPDFSKHYAQQPTGAQAAQAADMQANNVSAQSSAVDNSNQPAAQYADASWQQMKANQAKPADSQFQTNYAMQNVSAIHQQQQTHIPQQPHAMVHQPIQPHMQAQQNTYGAPFQPHMPVHPADAQRAAFPNWGQPATM